MTTERLPLCIDLDGTLVRTDTLIESGLKALLTRPVAATAVVAGFAFRRQASRAVLKDRLAEIAIPDPALLPYDEELLARLHKEKAAGRHIALFTAANHRIAHGVAGHLGLFDAVEASDGTYNLKGMEKARRLTEHYGEKGFVYIGDSPIDAEVWRQAAAGWAVGPAAQRTVADLPTPIEETFPRDGNRLGAWIKALRLHQWVKNVLVFVPVLAGGAAFDAVAMVTALLMFLAFGLVASGVYLLNDIADLEADRAHERKRHRPFAAGTLPIAAGLVAGPGLMLLGLAIALALAPLAAAALLGYVVLTTAYSLHLKTLPLIDAFALAGLYTVRILAGAAATGIVPSIWLLSFSGFLFLALALLKRVVEVGRIAEVGQRLSRRDYAGGEHVPLMIMGVSSTFASVMVFALYTDSVQAASLYTQPTLLWAIVPVLLFWQCRLWLSAWRGYVTDDPIVYSARDWVSWLTIGLGVLFYLLARVAGNG